MHSVSLTEREASVLQAVIEHYVATAGPAGSRTLARTFDLGISAATIRNTMADLEGKGFLSHTHTSAGRLPTDQAYRYYVDALMEPSTIDSRERARIERELTGAGVLSEIEVLVQRAAQVLGLLTGELGLSVGPTLAAAVLRKLEFVPIDSEKVLLVLTLESGVVRTVYVDLPVALPRSTLSSVAVALNERLAGNTLREIHETLVDRLRDLRVEDPRAGALINIFVESGPEIFEWAVRDQDVHLGSATMLANQPEFTDGDRLRRLIWLTEKRDMLASVLGKRAMECGPQVTIGNEHGAPELCDLTIVTASYTVGQLTGVVGVIGPTRMPYEKVMSIVDCTSSLVSKLIKA